MNFSRLMKRWHKELLALLIVVTLSEPTIANEIELPVIVETVQVIEFLGEFKITAYCPCEICCGNWAKNRPIDENGNVQVITASGELAVEGTTIAADTSILPFGTKIIINGNTYIVQDTGSAIKGRRIDVYFENHDDALEFGVQQLEVFLIKEEKQND